jgi:hypothetical protein
VNTYIEEFLTTFSGFHQTIFSFLTAYNIQQLFPQLTAHNNFFHSHSPTKQTHSHILTLFGWAYFGILADRSWNPNQTSSFCPDLWVKRFFLKPHCNGA